MAWYTRFDWWTDGKGLSSSQKQSWSDYGAVRWDRGDTHLVYVPDGSDYPSKDPSYTFHDTWTNIAVFMNGDMDFDFQDGNYDYDSREEYKFVAFGGDGDNLIATWDEKDTIVTYAGDDEVRAYGGNDEIHLGEGSDWASGGSGDDTITGDAGDDAVYGGSGEDTITGGSGNDYLVGGGGGDTIVGGSGEDYVAGGSYDGIDELWGDDADGVNEADTFFVGGDAPGATDGTSRWEGAETKIAIGSGVKIAGMVFEMSAGLVPGYDVLGKLASAIGSNIVQTILERSLLGADGINPGAEYGDNDYTLILDFDPRVDTVELFFGDWGASAGGEFVASAAWDYSLDQAVLSVSYDGQLMAKIALDADILDEIDDGDTDTAEERDLLVEMMENLWTGRGFIGVNGSGTATYHNIEENYGYDSDGDGLDDATYSVFGDGKTATDFLDANEGLVFLGNYGVVNWSGDGDVTYAWGTNNSDYLWVADSMAVNDPATLLGWGGSDVLVGAGGNDRLHGGDGDDFIDGGDNLSSDSTVEYDIVDGGNGADWLIGGGGFDIILGGDNGDGGAEDVETELWTTAVLYSLGDTVSYASIGIKDDGVGVTVDLSRQITEAELLTEADDLDNNGLFDEYAEQGILATTNDGSYSTSGNVVYGDVLSGIENVVGSANDDTITGDAEDNVIDPGAGGTDTLDGGEGDDVVDFSRLGAAVTVSLSLGTYSSANGSGTLANFETVVGTEYADTLGGDAEDNYFVATRGDDAIDGGSGWDIVDYSVLGAESVSAEIIDPETRTTTVTITFEGGTSLTQTLVGIEEVFAANLTVAGTDGDDVVYGSNGDDVVNGGGGDDTLIGTAGSDRVYGDDGDDVFFDDEVGGTSAFYGGAGNDLFHMYDDALESAEYVYGGSGYDIANFAEVAQDLIISSTMLPWETQLRGLFVGGTWVAEDVEHLVLGSGDDFVDGHLMDGLSIDGGLGNDVALLSNGDDVFIGSSGGDIVAAGEGDDTLDYSDFFVAIEARLAANAPVPDAPGAVGMVFSEAGTTRYDGVETVVATAHDDRATLLSGEWVEASVTFDGSDGSDTVSFGDGASAYSLSEASDGSIVVSRPGQSATVTLRNVEAFSFANVTIDTAALRVGGGNGSTAHEVFVDNAGNDTMKGNYGDDTFVAGEGDDKVYGDWSGDDRGSDETVVFGGRLSEYAITNGTTTIGGDTVSKIVVDDLLGSDGSDGIDEGTDTLYAVEYLRFADVTLAVADLAGLIQADEDAGSSTEGTDGDDVITARQGNFGSIYGNEGSDTFYGSNGDDFFYADIKTGGSSGTDTVHYDGRISDYEFRRSENAYNADEPFTHVIDRSDGGTDGVDEGSDRLAYFETVQFADVTIDPDNVIAGDFDTFVGGNQMLSGDGNDNVVAGSTGNDILAGGASDDILIGGEGDDQMWGGSAAGDNGSQDRAYYAGNFADYDISHYDMTRNGRTVDTVELTDRSGLASYNGIDAIDEGHDYVFDVEYLHFADYIIEVDALVTATATESSNGGPMYYLGTSGEATEYLVGTGDDDFFVRPEGTAGDAVVFAGAGDDTIKLGGAGSTETVVYAGSMAEYEIGVNGDGYLQVTDSLGADGSDGLDEGSDTIVPDVDYLQFADGRLDVSDAIAMMTNSLPRFTDPDVFVTVEENTSGVVHDAGATFDDADPRDTITWSLSGVDAARFAVDTSGVVTAAASFDHETPLDSDGDNVYEVTIQADDAYATARQKLTLTVEDVIDTSVVSGTTTASVTAGNVTTTNVLTLVNDDAKGASFVEATTAGAYGDFTVNSDGNWTYSRNDFGVDWLDEGQTQMETFTVSTSDGVDTDVTIAIVGANNAPVATATTLDPLLEDGSVTISGFDFYATTSDPDLETLTLTALAIQSGGGTLTDNGDNTWTYSAADNDDTSVAFSYTVSDGDLTASSTATLDLTPVNDAPVVSGAVDLGEADGDATATIPEAALLGNASDVDGDTLSVADLSASSGTLTGNGDGTWSFVPDTGDDADVTFSYEVSDGSTTVSAAATLDLLDRAGEPAATEVIGEAGTVSFAQDGSDQWFSVTFAEALENPAVVMGPISSNGSQPGTMRVRNVTDTGFEYQLDEWDYLDGGHVAETVSWIAIESGAHTVNGQTIVAGVGTASSDGSTIGFGESFAAAPTVFAQVTSTNDPDAVTDRIDAVTTTGFDSALDEEEANASGNAGEDLAWIAVENGGSAADGLLAAATGNSVTHQNASFDFGGAFADGFAFIADMQTEDGGDPATVRLDTLDGSGGFFSIEEEASSDSEVSHTTEVVAYLSIEDGVIFEDMLMV